MRKEALKKGAQDEWGFFLFFFFNEKSPENPILFRHTTWGGVGGW